jgi:hypothetical protein
MRLVDRERGMLLPGGQLLGSAGYESAIGCCSRSRELMARRSILGAGTKPMARDCDSSVYSWRRVSLSIALVGFFSLSSLAVPDVICLGRPPIVLCCPGPIADVSCTPDRGRSIET